MAEPSFPPYNVGDLGKDVKRNAPAAARNVVPIGDVLADWMPARGVVLEVASGTGEHALAFARRFPHLCWQPSDPDPEALSSIAAWQAEGPSNLRTPMLSQCLRPGMASRSSGRDPLHQHGPYFSLGSIDRPARRCRAVIGKGAPLILYGPWLQADVPTAPSNQVFDISLRDRDPRWGLRLVEDFAAEASLRGLVLTARQPMPSNNLMLRFEAQGT